LTVKGLTVGCTRLEFEYEIPYADAEKMLDELAEKPIIEKLRYVIPAGDGLKWEIDEFLGVNQGLIVAEIELPSEETGFTKPEWLGKEVTLDPSYFNSNLATHPFNTWKR
jgi:adenylate cyclase